MDRAKRFCLGYAAFVEWGDGCWVSGGGGDRERSGLNFFRQCWVIEHVA